VGKKSKLQSINGDQANGSAAASPVTDTETVQPAKRAKTAKRATGKAASKKKAAGTAAKKPAQRRRAPAAFEPSDADIRLRAYFIAERRVQLALQGDPGMDWLAAKQELLEEARQARP
jgi:hypothetical protein